MNGNKLRYLRENKELSQKELGSFIGISPSTIGMYEQGRREPDNETLKKLANYFEVSTDYLLDNDKNKTNDNKIKEKEALKNALISAGYIKKDEEFTNEELQKLLDFAIANKKFIKGNTK